MLDFLRKRKRSWIITLFLGIIVLVFVLWGVGSYLKGPQSENIAEVNGEVIDQREFEIQYKKMLDFYRDLLKGALTPETIKGLNLRGAIVEQLIQKHLLLQEAHRLGLEVSDAELRDAIARVPDFQINGRFNQQRYLLALRSIQLAPAQFETERRDQLSIQKLYDLIYDNVYVTDAELRERYRLGQERVNFFFIRLAPGDFLSQVQVTEDEIKGYYARNRDALKVPLKIQVQYLAYPYDYFASKVQVDEKEIEDYYAAHREERFHQPKGVHLRHILFRLPNGADAKQREALRARAEMVLKELRAGKDFAALAKQYSDDPSSAQGGDAGWLVQGQLLPSLEKVAFGLKKGEVSGVVESPLGYHILKVEEAREEKTKSLKEAKAEIVRSIRAERGRSEAGKAVDADREKLISGATFDQLAQQRGIPLKVTPFFSSTERLPDVGSVQEFNKTAFSQGVKEIGPAVEGPAAYYLLRVLQRHDAFIPPLESVRSDIEKRLKETKAAELASQKANALLAELKKEKDIKKVAAAGGLKVEETGWFVRSAPEIPKVGALQELRGGGIPISSYQPIPDRVFAKQGDLYLFAFKESEGADMEQFEKVKAQLRAQAVAEEKQRAVQRFIEGLKAKAQIKINPSSLEES